MLCVHFMTCLLIYTYWSHFDQRFIIFRPAHDIQIKLQLQIHFMVGTDLGRSDMTRVNYP
jgi:hypothetical protein